MILTHKCYNCHGKGYISRKYKDNVIQEGCVFCKGRGQVKLTSKEKDKFIKELCERLDKINERLKSLEKK